MTHSHKQQQQNKPPDPIITTSSSLNSSCSTLSVSPSPSVLLSSSNRRKSSSHSLRSPSTNNMPTTPSASSASSTSSSTATRNTKLEQIIQNFYTKTAQIIIQSRVSHEKLKSVNSSNNQRRKINKWFNVTTNDYEHLKQELKFWKSLVNYHPPSSTEQTEEIPPLIIDIYLETTEPELLQEGNDLRGWHKLNLNQSQHRILLESWTLSLNHPLPDFPVDLPNLYKRSIVFFRSLHSLVRLLPSHTLFRRTRASVHDGGEISLGYRISSSSSSSVAQADEVSFERPLTHMDTKQFYEFKHIVTPLGTFKLSLLYRENVLFDTREDTPTSLHGAMDVEEYFFTPTMTKYRQEEGQVKEQQQSSRPTTQPPPVSRTSIQPTPSFSSSSSRSNRLQSYRNIPSSTSTTTNRPNYRYPTTSISTTTATTSSSSIERRISAPFVSPFKSPSLSSSPQAELMFTSSRSQTPENQKRPESGSFGRKIEFSSSFEKFKSTSSSTSSSTTTSHPINRTSSTSNIPLVAPADMMRRWSRTSDHSSINLESEEDEEDLEEFMKFIGARQELKLFQQYTTSIYSEAPPPPPAVIASQQQQQKGEIDNEGDSRKSLSHFRNIQEAHNILSDSMSFSIHPAGQQQKEKEKSQQQQQASDSSSLHNNSYESSLSSSSLTKGLNLPVIPSPLHNTESLLMHPITTTTTTTSAKAVAPSISTTIAPHHRRHHSETTQSSPSSKQRQETLGDGFFSYPRGQPHHHQQNFQQMLTAHQAEIVAQSPLKNRQAPPLPPPPSAPTRRISGTSTHNNEDDDSLVFKMSELSAAAYEEVGDDYLQRFKQKESSTGMRRIHSSGHIPSRTLAEGTNDEDDDRLTAGHFSDDGTSTGSSKRPLQRLTHPLFFNDE